MEVRKGATLRGKKVTNWRCDYAVGCDRRRSTRVASLVTHVGSSKFFCWQWPPWVKLARSLRPWRYHGRWGISGGSWYIWSHVWLPCQKLSWVCRQKGPSYNEDSYRGSARHRLVHLGRKWFLLSMGERVPWWGPWLPKWWRRWEIQGFPDNLDRWDARSFDLPNVTHSVCWRSFYEKAAQAPYLANNLPRSLHVQKQGWGWVPEEKCGHSEEEDSILKRVLGKVQQL